MNDRISRYRSSCGTSPSGSRVRPRYVKDSSQHPPRLKKVGETDQYAVIQSFADSVDVAKLVARATAGDTSVLQRAQGLYFDATQLPTEMTEVANMGILAQNAWDLLTPEAKDFYKDISAFKEDLFNGFADYKSFVTSQNETKEDGTPPAEGEVNEA